MGREIGCAFGLLLFGQISLGRLPQSRPPLSRWLPIKSARNVTILMLMMGIKCVKPAIMCKLSAFVVIGVVVSVSVYVPIWWWG